MNGLGSGSTSHSQTIPIDIMWEEKKSSLPSPAQIADCKQNEECCFKPVAFGMVYYAAINNWKSPLAR